MARFDPDLLPEKYRAQIRAQLEAGIAKPAAKPADAAPAKDRVRQRLKPLLNKLEASFLEYQRAQFAHGEIILSQSITLKLANGVRYTPDFFVINHAPEAGVGIAAWEVKGPHAWDDAIVKLKVAAALYPWISFNLASGVKGTWRMQTILP